MNKNSNSRKWLELLITILFLAVGVAVAWGVLSTDVKHLDAEVRGMKPTINNNDHRITILETRQTAIYEGVRRIEAKIDKLN